MSEPKSGGQSASLDLSRPGIRDAVIGIGLASTVLMLTLIAAALRQFSLLGDVPDAVQIQIVTAVLLGCCVVAIRFGFSRIRYFNEELAARRSAEERALSLARHDPVTGLANRRFFVEQVERPIRTNAEF